MNRSFSVAGIGGWLILIILLSFGSGLSRAGALRPVQILYFYADGCHDCQEIKEVFLPQLLKTYGKSITVQYFNFLDDAAYRRLQTLERQLSRKTIDSPPVICIGSDILAGAAAIRAQLPGLIAARVNNKTSVL